MLSVTATPEGAGKVVAAYDPALGPALDFPLVEKKAEGFGRAGTVRQLRIGDVTGDGLADLMVLLNDRLLLYPQDALQGDM